MLNLDDLAHQEESFARAFAQGNIELARPLYHPEVVYLSPTVRLYDWPQRIEGVTAHFCYCKQCCQNVSFVYRTVDPVFWV